jgi:hypothetical protein
MTVLAHASGEWIASDWPVCRVAEIATPQRMGAALTYARRYALFTLVGIAGEDDLDASDLTACALAAGGEPNPREDKFSSRLSGNGRGQAGTKSKTAEVLDPAHSAALRDKLIAEVAALTSAEVAVTWANRILPTKNCGRCETPRGRFRAQTLQPRLLCRKRDFAARRCHSARSDATEGAANCPCWERRSSQRHRQECPGGRCTAPVSKPCASTLRRPAGVPRLRPQAL